MKKRSHKNITAQRRAHRVRAGAKRASQRPRLSVHVSNYHVSAQIIDDASGKTLAYATSVGNKSLDGNMTSKAQAVGEQIAKQAIKAKQKQVVFDRGSRLYHGRLKALADAARSNGLEF